jgi:hypothetical protein
MFFRINEGPAQRFLVQTDPQFVGTRSWPTVSGRIQQQ